MTVKTQVNHKPGKEEHYHHPKRKAREFIRKITSTAMVSLVTKGGRRSKFRVSIVIGNQRGKVGFGVASAKDLFSAKNKAIKRAEANIVHIPYTKNFAIPFTVIKRFCGTTITAKRSQGASGLTCCNTIKKILDCAGIQRGVVFVRGSTNPLNVQRCFKSVIDELIILNNTRRQVAVLSSSTPTNDESAKT